MSSNTVAEFAVELKKSPDTLLEQLQAAGVSKQNASDALTESDKQALLSHLQAAHGAADRKKITLTKKSTSEIKQADATGRARTIQVEVRKKRTFVKRDEVAEPDAEEALKHAEAKQKEAEHKAELVKREEEARREAELISKQEADLVQQRADRTEREDRERKEREAEERAAAYVAKTQERKAQEAAEQEEAARRHAQELAARNEAQAEAKKKAEDESKAREAEETARAVDLDERRRKALAEAEAIRAMMNAPKKVLVAKKPSEEKKDVKAADAKKGTLHKPATTGTGAAKPAAGAAPGNKEVKSAKLSSSWSNQNDSNGKKKELKTRGDSSGGVAGRGNNWRSGPRGRRGNDRNDNRGAQSAAPVEARVLDVYVPETITVSELAHKMAIKASEVIKSLMKMGQMVTINQPLDQDTAMIVVEEMGHKAHIAALDDPEAFTAEEESQAESEALPRAPVVTVMGHVDHGKTSLLDYIRRTKVAGGEAGGITQHIGAYHVETPKGVISFLDTPGHAAFTSMRARGAKLTDIVVLVVAADDGVMPQTKEAIQHARSAGVPLIVAINKIDKSGADPMRVKNELLGEQVVAEDFGGDIQMVEISAKAGTGIDNLLDAISIQAELLELKAVSEGRASGVVIESSLDKGRGPIATVLVQQGQLKKGDYLVCGIQYGRVRALFDETGKQPDSAGPSIPVQVLGLSGVPDAGDDFVVVDDERLAKDVAQQRDTKRRESRMVQSAGSRMEDIMATLGKGNGQQVLNLVIKADVQGSVQALSQALVALSNEDIRINVIHSGVGGITESDANSAVASKATVIGFNVRADASARRIIEANGVDLRYFSIIYDVIDQVKQVASGLLGVEIREEIIGIAQVRDVFRSSKFGAVAGCMVIEGVVKRSKPIRVLRDSVVVFEGELESLRRFKENVDEVRNGTECGIGVKAYNDVKAGDQIECFERIEVPRTL